MEQKRKQQKCTVKQNPLYVCFPSVFTVRTRNIITWKMGRNPLYDLFRPVFTIGTRKIIKWNRVLMNKHLNSFENAIPLYDFSCSDGKNWAKQIIKWILAHLPRYDFSCSDWKNWEKTNIKWILFHGALLLFALLLHKNCWELNITYFWSQSPLYLRWSYPARSLAEAYPYKDFLSMRWFLCSAVWS